MDELERLKMSETESRIYNSPQDIALKEHERYKARLNEIRREHPTVKRLEDYISKKYEEAKTSDSKSGSKKSSDLAFLASKIKNNFVELMDDHDYNLKRHGWHRMRLGPYSDDTLEIKLREIEGFFKERFNILMSNDDLSKEDKKQRESLVDWIRKNGYHSGRKRLFEDESSLYINYFNALINSRGWGESHERRMREHGRELKKIEALPPHKKYSKDYFTFLRILDNFRVKIENKVRRRKLDYNEYEHIVNAPTEQLFYELTKEHGLQLR